MSTPAFLDLLIPTLQAPLFTIAIDKWGTGIWDFGHIDASKYTGTLRTAPVDDNCNIGGSWKVSSVSAQFANGTMFPESGCGMFGNVLTFLLHNPPLSKSHPKQSVAPLPPNPRTNPTHPTDTGWDILNLDPALVARYYADVPGANTVTDPGSWTFPCSAPLPDLTLSLGGISNIVIPGRVLNYHPYNINANGKSDTR